MLSVVLYDLPVFTSPRVMCKHRLSISALEINSSVIMQIKKGVKMHLDQTSVDIYL